MKKKSEIVFGPMGGTNKKKDLYNNPFEFIVQISKKFWSVKSSQIHD